MKPRLRWAPILLVALLTMLLAIAADSDALDAPLDGKPGDALRGRDIVHDRRRGLCVLCHMVPGERFGGTIGPALAGVGSRMSAGQIRLRLVEPSRFNGQTVMPAYFSRDGFARTGERWRGQPILTAQEIEDVVAYLVTLKD